MLIPIGTRPTREKLVGREGSYVEVGWDPWDLRKVLVYTDEGFLTEAFNLELSSFHPSLEQLCSRVGIHDLLPGPAPEEIRQIARTSLTKLGEAAVAEIQKTTRSSMESHLAGTTSAWMGSPFAA